MKYMTGLNISFYGNKTDAIEIGDFLNTGGDKLFEKIVPIPKTVLRKTERKMTEWKRDKWGAPGYKKISDEIVHKENYSIFRFEFQTPYLPPYGILNGLNKKFTKIKCIGSIHNYFSDDMMVFRMDPEKGFQRCLNNLPAEPTKGSCDEPLYPAEISEEFLKDLSLEADLADALRMLGMEFPEMA